MAAFADFNHTGIGGVAVHNDTELFAFLWIVDRRLSFIFVRSDHVLHFAFSSSADAEMFFDENAFEVVESTF